MAPKTIFLDIDGCILEHLGSLSNIVLHNERQTILEGVRDKLDEWERAGCTIILTTGRKESMRDLTIKQLNKRGIFFDQLVMGLGGKPRVLINDKKKDGSIMATVWNLDRNQGLKSVQI